MEVSTIAAAAGVAHGTFYFHFPTKEHVLVELEQRQESRMAEELARFLDRPHDLADGLEEVVRLVTDLRTRVGAALFKQLRAAHFSPTRPSPDAFYSAGFFLLGVYGAVSVADHVDDERIRTLVAATVRGLEVR